MSLTRDAAGRPLYRDGTIRDVTERKQAEEARERLVEELAGAARELEQQRAVLEAVVQQMPAGLSVMDRSGKVMLSNQAARNLLGRAAESRDVEERLRALVSRSPEGRRYSLAQVPGPPLTA